VIVCKYRKEWVTPTEKELEVEMEPLQAESEEDTKPLKMSPSPVS